jgi:chemotaxis protein methyltransferase CheR
MNPQTFNRFRDIVYDRAGIHLNQNKVALVSSRIGKRMRELGCAKPEDYLKVLSHDAEGEEMVLFLDSITTNLTRFFREEKHFVFLERVVSDWLKAGQKKFRLWSAACSTGEEPYSMGISVCSLLSTDNIDLRILATDLSTDVLRKAQSGVYESSKLAEIPDRTRKRFFRPCPHDPDRFEVRDNLKQIISFRRLNLSLPPFPMQGPMDVIFCRNVMIYFDDEVRAKLVLEAHRLLRNGGYLLVGHSESLTGLKHPFAPVGPAIYQKRV